MKTKFILLISVFVFLGSTFCVFAAVPTTGLVGFWKLDEGSGTTTANSIPGGGLGTLINSPVWVKGVLDEAYALRFNGTNHQVKIADANLSNMSTITLSLWVHPFDNNGTLANSRIISKSDNSTSRFALSVGSDATSINFSAGFSGTAGSWKTPTNSLPLRIWHHVVVTYDYNTPTTKPKIYIDGILQSLNQLTSPSGSPVSDDSNLYFGSMGFNDTKFYNGFIDQVRIYNKALSSSEVQSLITSDSPIYVSAVGSTEIVFDWSTERCEVDDTPDAPARAWREANGQVSLIATHIQNYRMKGSSLNSVSRDCNKIMASTEDPVLENAKYYEWLVAPYTLDGNTIYSLVHAEWYPRLAGHGCANWWEDGTVTALTLAKSINGGATFTHPSDYKVWQSPVAWDPSFACTADYGGWNPSNIVKMGNYYYSLFLVVNDPIGYINKGGPYLMRTADLSSGGAWEIWTGSGWNSSLNAVGAKIDTMGVPESLTYNTYLGAYLLVANLWDTSGKALGVYYALSQDLINWTKPVPMLTGYQYAFYPSLLDPSDTSMNFEFSGQDPYVYYTSKETIDPTLGVWDRDLERQKIHFVKNAPPPPYATPYATPSYPTPYTTPYATPYATPAYPTPGGGEYPTPYTYPTPQVDGCLPGYLFNPNTGEACPSSTGGSLTKTLRLGMSDAEVKTLQRILNNSGFTVSVTGLGSKGNETSYFGLKTKAAVIKFQKANYLTPDGIVGPKSRAIINKFVIQPL